MFPFPLWGDTAPSSVALGRDRNSSSWRFRGSCLAREARPRCHRSSARRIPYLRSTAARPDRRGRGASRPPPLARSSCFFCWRRRRRVLVPVPALVVAFVRWVCVASLLPLFLSFLFLL